jgi:hypothetical protein
VCESAGEEVTSNSTVRCREVVVAGRELYFSAAQLKDLKHRATPPEKQGDGWVSTFEALSAFFVAVCVQGALRGVVG